MKIFDSTKLENALARSNGRRPSCRRRFGLCAVLAGCALSAPAATVTLHPVLDNSIYSESDASNALGGLFVGETPNTAIRRALLQFDLAASGIPAGSVIDQVTLSLTQIKIGPAGTRLFELRPLLAGWGEGNSSGTGSGGAATPGDATWNFRLFGSSTWTAPGGDFGSSSGTAMFGTANTVYTFDSTTSLRADVQGWLNTPGSNFGWLIRAADETPGITSARELGSRESALDQQPALTISYSTVPEPVTAGLLGMGLLLASRRKKRAT